MSLAAATDWNETLAKQVEGKTMEKYDEPQMEIIDIDDSVTLTSERCGSGNPADNEPSMANVFWLLYVDSWIMLRQKNTENVISDNE